MQTLVLAGCRRRKALVGEGHKPVRLALRHRPRTSTTRLSTISPQLRSDAFSHPPSASRPPGLALLQDHTSRRPARWRRGATKDSRRPTRRALSASAAAAQWDRVRSGAQAPDRPAHPRRPRPAGRRAYQHQDSDGRGCEDEQRVAGVGEPRRSARERGGDQRGDVHGAGQHEQHHEPPGDLSDAQAMLMKHPAAKRAAAGAADRDKDPPSREPVVLTPQETVDG